MSAVCALCGTGIPAPTGRGSRRRFCSDACRKTSWRTRHATTTRPGGRTATHVVPDVVVAEASRDDDPDPARRHRCPHCHAPLAIISVLVPAAAAVVHPPQAGTG